MTTHAPLVSVIIPNYNHAQYLRQRIESVLNQTYYNIEVIILDDNSTDDSLEIIEQYLSDKRITSVISNESNCGNTFLQWEKGLNIAKGSIIWIAESDDYCEEELLDKLVKAYISHQGTVLAYSTLIVVDENGTPTSWPPKTRNRFLSGEQYIKKYLTLGNIVRNASCAIFSKEAALSIKKDYISFSGAGDYLFWVRVAACGRVAIVNENLSYFRRHLNVVTDRRDADGTNLTAEVYILHAIAEYTRIPSWRKHLIYTHHCKRIDWTSFNTKDIQYSVKSLWEYERHTGLIDKLLWLLSSTLRKRWNFYI